MGAERSGGVELAELAAHLDRFLAVGEVDDLCPNGLQVDGRSPVRRLALGVSASLELFERARDAGADAILVHHGLFWRGDPRQLTGARFRRVACLVESELSLLAYHLPLDLHPEVGNNAVAARRLGLDELAPFAAWRGTELGVRGRFAEPLAPDELVARCAELYGQPPLAFLEGPERVAEVGILSGAGASALGEAIERGLDALVTGEPREWAMAQAREAGIHFLACGHYATERLGVQALGAHLEQQFGLETVFLEIPNPV